MARMIERLAVTSLKSLGPGLHHDGRGLYLQVKNGGRSWVQRYMYGGKARTMGLGPYPDVPLAKARTAASEARNAVREGSDPIEKRRAAVAAAQADAAKTVTFEAATKAYLKANRAGWKNAKHAAQWEATLQTYAYPVFGALSVRTVDSGLVLKVLEPIWQDKTETATRVRQRIEAVLDFATVHHHRSGPNPARWRGHLDKTLPKPTKVRKVQHFKAMPYAELPGFFGELRQRTNVSAKALAFCILTAARSGETLGARRCEIDFTTAVWTVPGERMKAGRDHRVPLTKEALALLDPNGPADALLFPNAFGKELSDAAMRKYVQEDMTRPGITVHGFRSTFKDWSSEQTNFASELAEAALGHVIGDKTEQAYRRGDALEKRRRLMLAWTRYCTTAATSTQGELVTIKRRA